jgi:uncharacterized protein (TIGR03083 family)
VDADASLAGVQDRKAQLRDELQTAQQGLLEALDRVGADDWLRGSRNEGWTIQSLLTHLATAERGFAATVRRMAAGEGGVPADFDPNRWNAGQLRRNADSTPAELRQRLESAHVELLAALDEIDEAGLDCRGYLSTGGEGSTEDCFRLSASHKRAHTDDIRAALSLAGV